MKIFVTVGSMLPFDRLIIAMDDWTIANPNASVFAQIGHGAKAPTRMEYAAMIDPAEYRKQFALADIVVSHVGMGTVITAAELGKPLVLLARRPELQEVTSTHQIATANWLCKSKGVMVAANTSELPDLIAKSTGADSISNIDTGSRRQLIEAIRTFIAN